MNVEPVLAGRQTVDTAGDSDAGALAHEQYEPLRAVADAPRRLETRIAHQALHPGDARGAASQDP
jgi:hypothetical protein